MLVILLEFVNELANDFLQILAIHRIWWKRVVSWRVTAVKNQHLSRGAAAYRELKSCW